MRANRIALTLAFGAGMLAALPAEAATCVLSGKNGTFQVAEIVNGSYPLNVSWSQRDPISPLVDNDTYSHAMGVWVISGQGVRPYAYVIDIASKGAPRGKVEVGGTAFVDQEVPTTWAQGLHGAYTAMTKGSFNGAGYIIAYGTGTPQGLTGEGRWQFGVSVACNHIEVPGEIVNFNQTHFDGTQVYAPSAGYGSNLRLDFPNHPQYNAMLGMIYARATAGTATVRAGSTPIAGNGTSSSLYEVSGSPALGGFTLHADYAGIDPLITMNAVLVQMPF